jgi:hypothetical protein
VGGGNRENDGGVNLRYIVSTYVNIIMYPPYNYDMLIKSFKNSLKKEHVEDYPIR